MSYLVHVKSKHIAEHSLHLFTPNKIYVLNSNVIEAGGYTVADDLTEKPVCITDSAWLDGKNWTIVKVQEIVKRDYIRALIENSKGKFISVSFIKKDGTNRTLIGRFGVTSHLKTESTPPTVDTNKFFVLWDTQNKGYRAVNKETIYEAKIGGKNYVVGKEND